VAVKRAMRIGKHMTDQHANRLCVPIVPVARRQLMPGRVPPAHILVLAVRVPRTLQEGVAAQVLMNLGLKLEDVRKEVMKGKLVEPERVEEKARKMMKGRKVKAPEDLDRILADWTYLVKHWNEKADELLMYKRFFGGRNVGGLKSEATKLVRKLVKLAE